MEGGELGLEFSSDSQSLSYVQADIPNNSTSMSVSCIANRTAGGMVETKSATIAISVVGTLTPKGLCMMDNTMAGGRRKGGSNFFLQTLVLFSRHFTPHPVIKHY